MKFSDLGDDISALLSQLEIGKTIMKDHKIFSLLSNEKRNGVLKNIEDIKDILLHSRYPKFCILGNATRDRRDLLSLFLNPTALERETILGKKWFEIGPLQVADLRTQHFDESEQALDDMISKDLPDIILCVIQSGLNTDNLEGLLRQTLHVRETIEDLKDETLSILYIVDEKSTSKQFYDIRKRINAEFKTLGVNESDRETLFSISRIRPISEACIDALPAKTRLPLVRLMTNKKAKSKFLDSIIQLSIATNSTIAGVPLPVADLIPITSVQTLMIVTIAYAHGQELNAKVLAAFLASLGINVGLGFAMRELVRALSQLIPVAGPFVSASIAGTTTATLGKQATKYFSTH